MDVGLFMVTHGLGATIDGHWDLQRLAADQVLPLEDAKLAEEMGFHSLWFSDHVAMPNSFASRHETADPVEGRSCYPDHPDLLDALTTMAAVAGVTEKILIAPSVLISPYRHPLVDARQLMTIDRISGGRLLVGVGAGWLKEEFDALEVPFDDRVGLTEECIDIYKRAWRDRDVEFHGRFFSFAPVSMDPKPLRPPPIVFGGASKLTARLAMRTCDGYYPTFVDNGARPSAYDALHQEALRVAEEIGRDPATFAMMAVVSGRVEESAGGGQRALSAGPPEAVLEDLQLFADAGYSLVVVHLDCPSGQRSELVEQTERFGEEVLGEARSIRPEGPWGLEILKAAEAPTDM